MANFAGPKPEQRGQQDIPNPTPRMPKQPDVKKGEGLASVKIPSFREFSSARFDAQMKTLLRELGKESKYFAEAARLSVTNRFTFKMYSPEDRNLSASVHADMATGHYGAFTLHEQKTIVINLDALRRKGKQLARPETEQLLKCLANESMHIICNSSFKMYSEREAQGEFAAVKAYDSPWSKAELSYQKVFVEELASKVAETTIRRQQKDPDFQFTSQDLVDGKHYYSDMKEHIASEVFSRMFEGASFDKKDQSVEEENVVKRIKFFMENGGVEQRVEQLLKANHLMN